VASFLLVLCLLGRFKINVWRSLSLLGLFFQLPNPSTIIQSSIICIGLPFDLFPNIFPSITVFNSDSHPRVCPIPFFCLVFIVRMMDLSSPIVSNTFSLVLCYVGLQLIFSNLLHVHISKASSLSIFSFLKVHVSEPYSTTLHFSVLIIRISNVLFTFLSEVLSSLRMLLFLSLFFF